MTGRAARRPTIRRLAHLLAVVVIAFGLAGCRLLEDTTAGGALLTVESRGGRCVEGECTSTIEIDRGGQVSGKRGAVPVTGQLDPALVGPLVVAVDGADYAAIMAVPFTGMCPTAVDGQEQVYTFRPRGREAVTFASCEVEIDPRHPLFIALDAALATIP